MSSLLFFITSANKEDCNRRCLSVCLSVCQQLRTKTSDRICVKFFKKVGNGPVDKCLNFGGDPDHRLDTMIVFRIRHYWEIRKVVNNRHKSAVHTNSPDGGTDKTCLGGGMHCPSASSLSICLFIFRFALYAEEIVTRLMIVFGR